MSLYSIKSFFNKKIYYLFLIIPFCIGCNQVESVTFTSVEIATAWADMTLYITQHTPANSPTYASRALGYIGLTMYETVVNGYPEYKSMAGQLNGLMDLPLPDPDQTYNWTLCLNAGQSEILKSLYNQTSDINKDKIDSLESVIIKSFDSRKDKDINDASIQYGKQVAVAIFEWSKDDGGHRGYLKNFDESLVHPERPGSWKPPLYAQSFSHHPLHPHWGENRTFVPKNASIPIPEMVPYDTTPSSDYYQQFIQVYEKDKILTQQEKEAAIWWGDDPDDTFSPGGHSYYIATIALREKKPTLIQCTETYARLGMALADAFINCWAWKYYHFSERPNTFIPKFIDKEWVSFWPDPPFPAFPSGHAIQASTAAAVLMDLYGNEFTFIDSAHVGRKRDVLRDVDFVARPFNTFWEVAEETADSRFYGGIHTPQDNEVGLKGGQIVAGNINELVWKVR